MHLQTDTHTHTYKIFLFVGSLLQPVFANATRVPERYSSLPAAAPDIRATRSTIAGLVVIPPHCLPPLSAHDAIPQPSIVACNCYCERWCRIANHGSINDAFPRTRTAIHLPLLHNETPIAIVGNKHICVYVCMCLQ